jgi:hypothetical protein
MAMTVISIGAHLILIMLILIKTGFLVTWDSARAAGGIPSLLKG